MEGTVRVGAIDLGTNTIRLLIADLDDGRLLDVERHTEVVGLGRGVDATGRFQPDRVEHALSVLATYAERLGHLGTSRVRAVATSATRDAEDGAEFLDKATGVLGARPDLISGNEEAALSFRGATAAIPGEAPTLVIDPGGGSTEFVLGGATPTYSVSLDIGSVRLTERLLPERPASVERVVAAASEVAEIFGLVRLPETPARVIGVAGTFTSLAAIALELDTYDRSIVHGSTLAMADLDLLVDRLSRLTVEETAAIPSLEPQRAPVLLGGAIVAREALRVSGHTEALVSEADLLDGIALGLA